MQTLFMSAPAFKHNFNFLGLSNPSYPGHGSSEFHTQPAKMSSSQSLHASSSHHSHSHSSHHHGSKDKGNKRKATRVQRACSNCRKRKQGCEEERPCRRCVEKGIDCVEIEPKRKRGRSKASSEAGAREGRSRSNSNGSQDDFYYDDEDGSDSYESDDDVSSSEDDQSAISPRGAPTNSASSTSANGLTAHLFKLNGSNTSSGSLPHSIPFIASHSISLSDSNSNVHSLSNSNSSVPTLSRESRPRRAHSIESLPDSPNAADDEPAVDADLPDDEMMNEHPSHGLNLGLLLPFIGNLCPSEEQSVSPMSLDDEFGYVLDISHDSSSGSDESARPATSRSSSVNQSGVGSGHISALHNKVWASDLPFFAGAVQSLPKGIVIEESDTKAQIFIKECWEEFQSRSKFQNMDADIQRSKELWKEVLKCLRCLDWQRVQTLLQEVEGSPFSQYFGINTQPSVLFWSSGGRIHHANDTFCKLVGYSAEELRADVALDSSPSPMYQGNTLRAHSFFHPEEMMKIMKRQLEAVQFPEKSSFQMNTRLLSKYRHEIPVSCSILNLRDTLGMSLLTVAIFV